MLFYAYLRGEILEKLETLKFDYSSCKYSQIIQPDHIQIDKCLLRNRSLGPEQ